MIKVGIIGTGVGIRTHLKGFRMLDGIEVKGISGSSLSRAVEHAKEHSIPVAYPSFRELCDDNEIDLVCVTSPNKFHYEHVIYAIEAGKHVICEKPLAMNSGECEAIVETKAKIPESLGILNHQLRMNPYIRSIRSLVQGGAVGRPYYCRIHQQGTAFANRAMPWSWSFDAGEGGGVRLAMGSHLIDLTGYIFGFHFAAVNCSMASVVDKRQDAAGNEHFVSGSGFSGIRAHMADGLCADLTATAAAFGRSLFDISIYGDEGEIQFDLVKKLRISDVGEFGCERLIDVDGVFDDERTNKASIFSGSFRYLVPELFNKLANRADSKLYLAADFSQGLAVQRILDASLESYKTQSMVRLNDVGSVVVDANLF